jgi:hypothetical protein
LQTAADSEESAGTRNGPQALAPSESLVVDERPVGDLA